jgi:signal transduction histidine kinase/DNA-binding response OmpR family regulator
MLLDFARLEAGRLTPRFAEHDLARLTTEHASAFQSAFERAGVTLAIDCQPLPGAVWLDEELWEKIVLNLLSNALKFTFAGEVRLTLRAVDGSAELQVSDTGTGIPAHELPAIFQRFHRVAGARARSHEGTGIGLALSHDLVRLQGGTIAVASELGRGSVFTVRLPIGNEHLSPQQLSAATEESLSAAGPSSEARHFRAGMRAAARMVPQPSAAATGHLPQILIVEDNADMRDYLVRVLAPQFELTVADNGRRALELTRELESPPDLVLSDVMMPELDGFELLRELRGTAASSSIPVLLLSARAGDDARVEGLQAGADDYLVKPFSARELIARVSAQVALGRARRDARRVQEGLRAIFQQAPVAVSVVRGPDFTFELANPRYEQMVARAGLVGRKFREAFPELPDDAPVLAMLEAVRQSGDTFAASEYPVPLDLRGEGNVQDTFFMFSCQPLTEPTPGDAILTVAIDVTEQVNMRRELETLSKEREWLLSQEQNARAGAEAANRVKDEFLAMLGHELRNPLAPIATALALLRQRGPLSKEQVIIERQVGHLTRLVEDLLDVSRITRGKVELRREPVNIAHAVQRAVELASPLLEQRRHHLQLVVPESGLEVFGDPTRLAQAVANLLSNAAKYTDPGGRIEVRAGPLSEVDVVEIAVIDNGIGIDPAMLDHIFDAFAQASQAIDRSNGGLGLGLTIVRNLIELHGGSVAADSGGKGRGSEFTLRLPRYHRMPGDATAPVDTPEAPPSRLFQRMRVLVVDDNEDAAQLLADWFLRRGAVVSVAHDGLTALAIAEHMTPQLGIIDLGLPALSGYDVARRLRANHTAEPLLLVAVTGYGQVSDREQSADAGFEAHCVKPVDLGEFEQLLGRLLLRS